MKPIKCFHGHIPAEYLFSHICEHCQNLIHNRVGVKNGRGCRLTPLKRGPKPKAKAEIKPKIKSVPARTTRVRGRQHQLRTILQLNGVHIDDLQKVEDYCAALITARELMNG